MFISPAVSIALASAFGTIFANGFMDAYAGVRPTDPTKPATGTKIGHVTNGGLPVTPGSPTNGLTFATAYETADGLWVVLPFHPSCVPTLHCTLAAGQSANLSYLRLYPNAADDGLEDTDNTRPRMDILASTVLDASLGGFNSTTGSLKIYGQSNSVLNIRELRFPLSNGQQLVE